MSKQTLKYYLSRVITSKWLRKLTRLFAYLMCKHWANTDLKSLDEHRVLLTIPAEKADVLYLRTDFWLHGKSSNGAMAHTIGVVDALAHLCHSVQVYSIDRIGYLRPSILQTIHPATGWLAGLNELGEVEYSHHLAYELYEQIKENPPSFIYQRYGRNNYVGVLVAHWLHIPCIMEYNGSEIWMAQNWGHKLKFSKLAEQIELSVFKAADLIVGNAQALKEELIVRGIDENKILIVPNGVDPDRFNPQVDGSAIRDQYGLTPDNVVVTFVGSFGPWHGTEVLASAIKEVIDVNSQVRFMFVGAGVKLQEVMAIVEQSGVKDYVIFTGMIPQNITPQYLAASDILVSPTIPNPDGTPFFGSPTKLFEYMAMGKAIVASSLDQIGEILTDKQMALLTEPRNPHSLAKAILSLASNPTLAQYLGRNACEEVMAKYSWKIHVHQILQHSMIRDSNHKV